jgi:hypothetical protein
VNEANNLAAITEVVLAEVLNSTDFVLPSDSLRRRTNLRDALFRLPALSLLPFLAHLSVTKWIGLTKGIGGVWPFLRV